MPAGADQEARSAPPSNGEVYAYLRCYVRLMRELFDHLILDPLVLPLNALEAPGGQWSLPARLPVCKLPDAERPFCCRAAQNMHADCLTRPSLSLARCPPACPPACLPGCLRLCAESSDVAVRTQRSRDLCKRFMVAYHKLAWREAVRAAKALLRAGTPCAGYQSQAMREAQRQLDAEADAAVAAAGKAVRRTRRRMSGDAGAGEGGAAAVCTASLDLWGQPQVQVSEGEWPACLPAWLQVGITGQWQWGHLPA
jgi:hypothetical protein